MTPTETTVRGQSAEAGCPLFVLSNRERETLRLAALGCTTKEIALRLAIAEVTAKKHLQAARAALGAANTVHAVAIALSKKLIEFNTTVH